MIYQENELAFPGHYEAYYYKDFYYEDLSIKFQLLRPVL